MAAVGLVTEKGFLEVTGFGGIIVFVGLTVFRGATSLTEMVDTNGIEAFATFFSPTGFIRSEAGEFLFSFFTLMIGLVVDVPQSVQYSLYSTMRRPHFRQNGI